jgi:predicted  nucleic acid-binding Zn-ribbon protein
MSTRNSGQFVFGAPRKKVSVRRRGKSTSTKQPSGETRLVLTNAQPRHSNANTNALLTRQLEALTKERNSLKTKIRTLEQNLVKKNLDHKRAVYSLRQKISQLRRSSKRTREELHRKLVKNYKKLSI